MQLPDNFIRSLANAPAFNEQEFVNAHNQAQLLTSIRVNPAKPFDITQHFAETENVAWCKNGYYLPQRPLFTADMPFVAGAYYVQEASSMFLEHGLKHTVNLSQPLNVLDLCAAPGGKSTLIQSLITPNSLLVANEVIKTRVSILADNLTKWGAANCIVTNNDAADIGKLTGFFDVIVIDAPCSGSGLFRKDENAIAHWSDANVNLCSQRQQRILADVLPALKENGILIYSTCSYSVEENETIVDFIINDLQAESLQLPIQNFEGIVETTSNQKKGYGYRFYPNKIKGEGFFMAAFKNTTANYFASPISIDKKQLASTAEKNILAQKVDINGFEIIKHAENFIAFPENLLYQFFALQQQLYIKKAGTILGEIIKNQLVPQHALAMCASIANAFKKIEVGQDVALSYLRKNNIEIDTDYRGWALLTCQGFTLGFVKVLQGRVNNYYPSELRILHK
jgi:16S rRNA C967 or C1407 C5-methylase (RsmB/RsmF family)/NOL1/NOP2/fmu family ribosome biogenesis protein